MAVKKFTHFINALKRHIGTAQIEVRMTNQNSIQSLKTELNLGIIDIYQGIVATS